MPACTSGCPYNRRVGVKVTAVPDRVTDVRDTGVDGKVGKTDQGAATTGQDSRAVDTREDLLVAAACRLTATVDSNVVGSGGTERVGVSAQ